MILTVALVFSPLFFKSVGVLGACWVFAVPKGFFSVVLSETAL